MPTQTSSIFRWLMLSLVCSVLLVACETEPTGQDGTLEGETETPSAVAASPVAPGGAEATPSLTPSQLAARFFVQGTDKVIYLVSQNGGRIRIGEGDFQSPIESTLPSNPVTDGRAFLLTVQGPAESKAYAVGQDGAQALNFIQGAIQELAVWPGNGSEPARLAWDGYNVVPGSTDLHSQIVVSNTDGSDQQVLIEETGQERILVVGRWSADGKRLYYSKEPLGLGGYILFGGASDLWVYDFESGESRQLFSDKLGAICIDDLSRDETHIAEHCALDVQGVVDLNSGDIGTIATPAGLGEKVVVGGARFDPASQRLAYAMALNNPEAEQGWAGISDSLDGSSDLLAEAPLGEYFRIATWLNEDLIVLQSEGATPGIWTIRVDGSDLKHISDGTFLGVEENP
jgi:hypothetical protein